MKSISLILPAIFLGLLAPTLSEYQIYLLSLTLLWSILALGMGLILGYAGEVNFGQAGFVAISAYVSTLLRTKLGFSFWEAAPIALATTVGCAAIVGSITMRLRGPFFVLVMLAFGEIVRLILSNWQSMTNGPLGLRQIAPPEPIFGMNFQSKLSFFYLILAVLTLVIIAMIRLVNSRMGRVFVAAREDELLAEFLGVPLMKSKVIALSTGAFVGALGGLLLAPFLTVLSPSQFSMFAAVDMVVMVIVGGAGTIVGPIMGAIFLVYVPELLSFSHEIRPILMGTLLILATMFIPSGLAGFFTPYIDRFISRWKTKKASL
jgi:branched-chain amino acid transport system permease protein